MFLYLLWVGTWSLKSRDECKIAALVHGMLGPHLHSIGMKQLKAATHYIMSRRMKDIPRQHIIRIIKTRNRRRAQHIGRMEENRKAYRNFVGKKAANRKT
jgi:hypothetical protein